MKRLNAEPILPVGGQEITPSRGEGQSAERPILFSGPMVCAILAGRKTQTRRVVKLPPAPNHLGEWKPSTIGGEGCYFDKAQTRPAAEEVCIWHTRTGAIICCPYGAPGDRLWVRETWAPIGPQAAIHQATNIGYPVPRWKPSIHMPRWVSRLTLEVVSVRVERVQEISADDVLAEGVPLVWGDRQTLGTDEEQARQSLYGQLWDSINGKRPGCAWADNPWVWVTGFAVAPLGTESAAGIARAGLASHLTDSSEGAQP